MQIRLAMIRMLRILWNIRPNIFFSTAKESNPDILLISTVIVEKKKYEPKGKRSFNEM